jgi:hypothetical protein
MKKKKRRDPKSAVFLFNDAIGPDRAPLPWLW